MDVIGVTERLTVRQINSYDAEFIIQLLNDQSFIQFIGDKNVRTTQDAVNYINKGPISSYKKFGFGTYIVSVSKTNQPIGMCGLLKRSTLDFPDLGFAFLSEFCGYGYAAEATEFIIKKEIHTHNLTTILAVTLPLNLTSNKLLRKMGFTFKSTMEFNGLENNLYEYNV